MVLQTFRVLWLIALSFHMNHQVCSHLHCQPSYSMFPRHIFLPQEVAGPRFSHLNYIIPRSEKIEKKHYLCCIKNEVLKESRNNLNSPCFWSSRHRAKSQKKPKSKSMLCVTGTGMTWGSLVWDWWTTAHQSAAGSGSTPTTAVTPGSSDKPPSGMRRTSVLVVIL